MYNQFFTIKPRISEKKRRKQSCTSIVSGILLKINSYNPGVPLYFIPSTITKSFVSISNLFIRVCTVLTEVYAINVIDHLFSVTTEKHVYVFLSKWSQLIMQLIMLRIVRYRMYLKYTIAMPKKNQV